MAVATTPDFTGSIELMAAQRQNDERMIAEAVALGGHKWQRGSTGVRVYFETPVILNLVGVTDTAERDAAEKEIKKIYFEPRYGWMVIARRMGPWRKEIESRLIANHDIDAPMLAASSPELTAAEVA